jgi:hypothetical protein
MVSAEQQLVLNFLRSSPETAFGAMEISRRAGNRKQFEKDPRWAVNCLRYLVDMKLVERDNQGHYKLAVPQSEKGPESH